MKNWKAILQSNTFFFLFFIVVFLYVGITFLQKQSSLYEISQTTFQGKIVDYRIDGDSLSLTIRTPEKLKVFYTIKSETEKEHFTEELGYGKEVFVQGILEEAKGQEIPNTFHYRNYLYYNRIYYLLNAEKIEVKSSCNIFYSIKNLIHKYLLTLENSEYFLAFLLGDTKNYDLAILRENGVSHLFAVSGMHISLFVLVLRKLLKRVKFGNLFLCIFLIFYAFLVGFTPSVLRVVILFILGSLNKKIGNVLSNKKMFFYCFFLMLLLEPFYFMNLGFQYSFLISFSFLYLKEEKNYIKNLLKTSFLAFLVSLPVTAINFYEVNVLGILLNLLFVPFVSFLLYPACFFVLLFPFISPIYSFLLEIFEGLNVLFSNISIFKIVLPKTFWLFWIFYFLIVFLYI